MIEIAEDAIAFGNPCLGKLATDRVEATMSEKIGIAIAARLPDRSMLGRNGKVGAGETRAFSPQHGVRPFFIAEAGRRFDAIDAIAPVADPEAEISLFHQEADLGLGIAVTCASPELRASGNHPPALAAKRCGRQHLFEIKPERRKESA